MNEGGEVIGAAVLPVDFGTESKKGAEWIPLLPEDGTAYSARAQLSSVHRVMWCLRRYWEFDVFDPLPFPPLCRSPASED